MARGWESKSVEDQIAEREAELKSAGKKRLTPAEIQLQSKREGLLLARARVESNLQSARDARYRDLLTRTLEDLDKQLAFLDKPVRVE